LGLVAACSAAPSGGGGEAGAVEEATGSSADALRAIFRDPDTVGVGGGGTRDAGSDASKDAAPEGGRPGTVLIEGILTGPIAVLQPAAERPTYARGCATDRFMVPVGTRGCTHVVKNSTVVWFATDPFPGKNLGQCVFTAASSTPDFAALEAIAKGNIIQDCTGSMLACNGGQGGGACASGSTRRADVHPLDCLYGDPAAIAANNYQCIFPQGHGACDACGGVEGGVFYGFLTPQMAGYPFTFPVQLVDNPNRSILLQIDPLVSSQVVIVPLPSDMHVLDNTLVPVFGLGP
jgi:hypothetical protein